MQFIASSFAKYNHKKTHRVGHLFQGRYKSKIVQDEKYLIALCYYIHMNPLNAKVVADLEKYTWSSHLAYADKQTISWLTRDLVYSLLSTDADKSKSSPYLRFIVNKRKQEDLPHFCEFDEAGNLSIKDRVIKIKTKEALYLQHLSVETIAQVVCDFMKINFEELSSSSMSRKIGICRSVIAYFAHYCAGYYLKEIAYLFFRKPESVSETLCRHLTSVNTMNEFQSLISRIEVEFKKQLI
jgi:putative transposase